ncbi:ACP synthase, partial [Acinetobacter baumannii]
MVRINKMNSKHVDIYIGKLNDFL